MKKHHILKGTVGTVVVGLVLALAGCGGGDDSADAGPAPSFVGNYDVTLTKTKDTCSFGFTKNLTAYQTVSQDGRAIVMVSNQVTLKGTVDADNAGISTSFQQTNQGVLTTTTMIYRSTDTQGVYGAGFSVAASDGGRTCSVSYNGTAKRR